MNKRDIILINDELGILYAYCINNTVSYRYISVDDQHYKRLPLLYGRLIFPTIFTFSSEEELAVFNKFVKQYVKPLIRINQPIVYNFDNSSFNSNSSDDNKDKNLNSFSRSVPILEIAISSSLS